MRETAEKVIDKSVYKNTLEALTKARDDWMQRFERKSADSLVAEKLNPLRDKILGSILGLRIEYSGVSWDTTNSRTSPLIKKKKKEIDAAACKWIDQNMKELPQLVDDTSVAKLRQSYLDEYRSSLTTKIRELARKEADKDAETVIKMVGYDPDDLIKLLATLATVEVQKVPKLTGRGWNKTGILADAIVVAVVTIDEEGCIRIGDIEMPDADVWCLVKVIGAWSKRHSHIITNGHAWHPVDSCLPDFVDNADTAKKWLDANNIKAVSDFKFGDDRMFNFMNELDESLISQRVIKFLGV